MRKIIAAFNMTIDGVCDHTAGLPDSEIHAHYTNLLNDGGEILYGRTTYELMKFWQSVLENPSGERTMDEFALAIDRIPKTVFSNTLKNEDSTVLGWESARLAKQTLHETVLALKQEPGRDILIGSRSLIVQLLNLHLIDEFQLCVYPVIAGKGLLLFEGLHERAAFRLINSKTFESGAVLLHYNPNSPAPSG
ncbi:MAG: dihydrofolate reductase family protein [Weeksellaceae bacterium]|nr:dihydrofolate reductase family protein [Weeksellaceae bacterium]